MHRRRGLKDNQFLDKGVRAIRRLPAGDRIVAQLSRRIGGPETREQWARVIMNERTSALVEALGPGELDVLEISGGRNSRWREMPFRSYQVADYPEYDICSRPLAKNAFDLIIAEQVFEHVLSPDRAARHTYEMLKPGGWALITTPFLIRIHNEPTDCTRWTPLGLRSLLETGGFDGVEVDSWGNRECVIANFGRWKNFRPGKHSLENEPDFPVVVWALARKTREEAGGDAGASSPGAGAP